MKKENHIEEKKEQKDRAKGSYYWVLINCYKLERDKKR